ncbi:MAG TPA: hypothetical protein DD738_12325 [Ruminiclostridium sp.]|nr:hypothetical protein [Ruminiclostridium sp.]
MTYFPDGVSLNRGQKVTFKADFDISISWELRYSGAGYNSVVATGSGKSINKSFNMPADGTYKFHLKNNSSETVTVKSGSITY